MSRILIVDDEVDVVKLMKLTLKKYGYEIFSATDGEMGVALSKETKPDFILLDVKLPKMSGYEVFKAIRKEPELTQIPIVFATADASVNVTENVELLGAQGYLLKPFAMSELIGKIQQFLN